MWPIVYKLEVFQTISEIRCMAVSLIHSFAYFDRFSIPPGLSDFLPRVPRVLLGITPTSGPTLFPMWHQEAFYGCGSRLLDVNA